MASLSAENGWAPRWVYRWAVTTVAATLVLLVLGSVVTTFRVGMADPVWPTAPWHLLLISYDEPKAGFLIEHTHRAAGYLVGCCVIVLAVGLLWARTARWLKGLGLVALAAVVVQGLLGGFRVRLNALLGPNLAVIHGIFAQVVFSILVSVAVCTSPRFASAALPAEDARRLRTPAGLLAGLAAMQLCWGVLLRHLPGPFVQRAHLVTAFAVVGTAVWLAATASGRPEARALLRGPIVLLVGLLAAQVCLGVEAWLGKFEGVMLPELESVSLAQAVVRTGHVIVGAGILASCVTVALLVWRPAALPYPQPEGTP
jgi:heme A synthase